MILGSSTADAILSSCSGKTAGDAALAGITKAGTLLKQCSPDSSHNDSKVEWMSLFFVLNSHSLTYYPPGQRRNLSTPGGDILLTSSTKIVESNSSILRIDTGFETYVLRAKDAAEATEWKRAIQTTVDHVSDLPRGYFTKIRRRRRRRKKRFFYMLHEECITHHDAHAETSTISSSILPLLETTTVSTFGTTGILIMTGTKKWKLIADTKREQNRWMNAILHTISSKQIMSALPLVPSGFSNTDLDGFLSCRQPGGVWLEYYFVLTKDTLHRIQQDELTHKTSSKQFVLTPNTLVSSTNLNTFSFEVVTFSDVLHLNAPSKDAKAQWVATIRGLVAAIKTYSKENKLQKAALSRDCTYYNVLFRSTNSPGLIMERRGDLAIVAKVTRSLRHRVFTGSVLISVNKEPVVNQPYEFILNMLSNW